MMVMTIKKPVLIIKSRSQYVVQKKRSKKGINVTKGNSVWTQHNVNIFTQRLYHCQNLPVLNFWTKSQLAQVLVFSKLFAIHSIKFGSNIFFDEKSFGSEIDDIISCELFNVHAALFVKSWPNSLVMSTLNTFSGCWGSKVFKTKSKNHLFLNSFNSEV